MGNPLYVLACPSCGGGLEPHAGEPDSAPWTCHHCHYGFWVAELTQAARQLYRARFNDFGWGPEALALKDECYAERDAARERGTSCLPEHLGLLTREHLDFLHKRFPLSDDFRERVRTVLEG